MNVTAWQSLPKRLDHTKYPMEDLSYLTDKKFTEFDLVPELLQGLEAAGFNCCTKIQAESLPLALAGNDVAGQAQTGTGKTAAFLLAIFNHLLTRPRHEQHQLTSVRAVVLAPTRELAIQIHRDARLLGKYTDLRLGLVYGGTGYQQQRDSLSEGVDVLIGTPGRLIDYFRQGVFDLKSVQVVVLDEADRMFDLGFIKDIRFILRRMPPPAERLNLLFSATLSHRVHELGYEHMNDPNEIKIDADTVVVEQLVEEVYYPANPEKLPLLLGLLKQTGGERVLIFANMRIACDRLGRALDRQGFSAGVLSGDVPQKKREQLLKAFKEGRRQILVATDVAARGLHIPSVSHVFNYDLPQDAEDYVHRIGRTARAGASGHAISFACEDHAFSLVDIEDYIGHALERREISEDLLEQPVRGRSQGQPDDGPRKQARGERKHHADRRQRQGSVDSKDAAPGVRAEESLRGRDAGERVPGEAASAVTQERVPSPAKLPEPPTPTPVHPHPALQRRRGTEVPAIG